jgi:tRNA G18 (ribose-2'-O)-methylase SpoU
MQGGFNLQAEASLASISGKVYAADPTRLAFSCSRWICNQLLMSHLTAITNPNDPLIESYRSVRERDLVGRQGRFVAEGEVVLRLLARRGRFGLESVLISDKRIASLADLVDDLPAHCPVYVASQAVMDAIVGFPIHRGVLAIGLRGEEPDAEALLAASPPNALVVACIGIANHDNIGGIFRNAAAFGASTVLLDGESCDPLYRKAIRVSVGAALTVPFARIAEPAELIETLQRQGFLTVALSPRGAETLDEIAKALSGRVALLLGAEGPGLPADVLEKVRSARIPMAGDFDSLNVATTSGVALYALSR